MKLIDKSALVAEIERFIFVCDSVLLNKDSSAIAKATYKTRKKAYNNMLSFIDSLQKEPVSEDLEKAAIEAFKNIVDNGKNSFLEIFKAGANWQKQQLLKNAVSAEVNYWNQHGLSIRTDIAVEDLAEEGDKIKVIIIKQE